MYRGIIWNAMASYNKKVKTTRSEIVINGINQYATPILTDNPETNWRFNGSVSKKIYRFNLKLNTSLSGFNYTQNLNNNLTTNDRTNQNFGVTHRTVFKKWPDFSLEYNKGFSQFSGITENKYQNEGINSDVEFTIKKFFTFKFEYENLKNTNSSNQSNFYDIASVSLRYQKKNSPYGFELFANNLFDNRIKNDFSFSDYMISETRTYVLPRVVMISLSYKL